MGCVYTVALAGFQMTVKLQHARSITSVLRAVPWEAVGYHSYLLALREGTMYCSVSDLNDCFLDCALEV